MQAAEGAAYDAGDFCVGVFRLSLAWRSGAVRIEAWDTAPGSPVLREPDWDAENGRGLFIVDSITDGNWGWDPYRDGSKCVWAVLGG
jgi:hypothetical protein